MTPIIFANKSFEPKSKTKKKDSLDTLKIGIHLTITMNNTNCIMLLDYCCTTRSKTPYPEKARYIPILPDIKELVAVTLACDLKSTFFTKIVRCTIDNALNIRIRERTRRTIVMISVE